MSSLYQAMYHAGDTKAIHGLVSDGMRYKFDAVEQTWHVRLTVTTQTDRTM